MTETIEKRGGARKNAGRKPKTLSQKRIDDLLRAARKYAKAEGKTPEEILLDIVYKTGEAKAATLHQQLHALQTYFRHTMPTSSEQNVNVVKNQAPALYLPEQDPDPVSAEALKEAAEQHVTH